MEIEWFIKHGNYKGKRIEKRKFFNFFFCMNMITRLGAESIL